MEPIKGTLKTRLSMKKKSQETQGLMPRISLHRTIRTVNIFSSLSICKQSNLPRQILSRPARLLIIICAAVMLLLLPIRSRPLLGPARFRRQHHLAAWAATHPLPVVSARLTPIRLLQARLRPAVKPQRLASRTRTISASQSWLMSST